jgi:hypothetical protein
MTLLTSGAETSRQTPDFGCSLREGTPGLTSDLDVNRRAGVQEIFFDERNDS